VEAMEKVVNELDRKSVKLVDWEGLHQEKVNEYKVHDIFVRFAVDTKSKKEAEQTVFAEMAQETMRLRNWKIC
jgi:tartrate dehydratase beta subunit/fumarate hydratase class I family protein